MFDGYDANRVHDDASLYLTDDGIIVHSALQVLDDPSKSVDIRKGNENEKKKKDAFEFETRTYSTSLPACLL